MNYKTEQGGLWEFGGDIIAIFATCLNWNNWKREGRSCRAWRIIAPAKVQRLAKNDFNYK